MVHHGAIAIRHTSTSSHLEQGLLLVAFRSFNIAEVRPMPTMRHEVLFHVTKRTILCIIDSASSVRCQCVSAAIRLTVTLSLLARAQSALKSTSNTPPVNVSKERDRGADTEFFSAGRMKIFAGHLVTRCTGMSAEFAAIPGQISHLSSKRPEEASC
jgi:hypothetical protein